MVCSGWKNEGASSEEFGSQLPVDSLLLPSRSSLPSIFVCRVYEQAALQLQNLSDVVHFERALRAIYGRPPGRIPQKRARWLEVASHLHCVVRRADDAGTVNALKRKRC